jgi:hypothetical protein
MLTGRGMPRRIGGVGSNSHPMGDEMNGTTKAIMLGAVVSSLVLAGCGGTQGASGGGATSAAVAAAAQEAYAGDGRTEKEHLSAFEALLIRLRDVPQLAPLFDMYKVPDPIVLDDDDAAGGLVEMLHAIRITVRSGIVTITNRETGGVIYSAPMSDLASGEFHPENLPGGTGVPTTCTSFNYSAWGACQPDNTQTRTVVSSSPAGCTGGNPALSQACVYTPPNPVTFNDVVASCTGCHGLTSNTTVFRSGGYTIIGRSASQWLTTMNSMVARGASLASGTTAQNYADYLANVP